MPMVPQLTPGAARDHKVFRSLVSGFSQPGTLQSISPDEQLEATHQLAMASVVCRCLLDHEVSFFTAGFDQDVTEHLLRVTGSHVAELSDADYILTSSSEFETVLNRACTGTDEYPELSATVIVICDRSGLSGATLRLTGPGIPGHRTVNLKGVSAAPFELLADINFDYPLGIDVILVSPDGSVVCLPRTTKIEHSTELDGV